jgi:hypothetical protein
MSALAATNSAAIPPPDPLNPTFLHTEWVQATALVLMLNQFGENVPNDADLRTTWFSERSDQFGRGIQTIGTAIRHAIADQDKR